MSKSRELIKLFNELAQMGVVEVKTAQEAVKIRKYAEASGMIVGLSGSPGKWRVYDMTEPMGFVV
jgi:ribosomal protein S3